MATLIIENLTKVFPPTAKNRPPVQAINDLSLELSGHVFVSIVGPSGCGKSTLLNILSGTEPPTSGRISVTKDDRPARLGYVFQDARLLPWRTVMDNMLYVQDGQRERARENARRYLAMVGLDDVSDSYPGQLSGGMQQRAGIARAFSVDPDLLLMDEPFSHLDAITARSLREQLQALWEEAGKTVLFVTHDIMEAVQLSDRIVVLSHGGRIHADIAIDLPRPRKASDPEVAAVQAEILGRFEDMEQEAAAV
ncbi:MAG TPA: ABC transporter ATP-binding protein [Solirubrobacteraceae bacterium]|nr:ABC transporter ATP-binding protein [Solirubrobacteraceae bacterium]